MRHDRVQGGCGLHQDALWPTPRRVVADAAGRTARRAAGGTTGRAAVAAEPPDVPRPYRQTLCRRHRETRHGCCRTARRVAPGTTKHAATAVLRSTAGIPTIR